MYPVIIIKMQAHEWAKEQRSQIKEFVVSFLDFYKVTLGEDEIDSFVKYYFYTGRTFRDFLSESEEYANTNEILNQDLKVIFKGRR